MKKEQVKVGMVVYCRHCKAFKKVTQYEFWHGITIFSLDNEPTSAKSQQGHLAEDLRPLTARERGHAIEELDDNALPPAAISCSDATAVEAARKPKDSVNTRN